jgi:hypothetical protein
MIDNFQLIIEQAARRIRHTAQGMKYEAAGNALAIAGQRAGAFYVF